MAVGRMHLPPALARTPGLRNAEYEKGWQGTGGSTRVLYAHGGGGDPQRPGAE